MMPPRGHERAKYLRDRRIAKENAIKDEIKSLQAEIEALYLDEERNRVDVRQTPREVEIEICKGHGGSTYWSDHFRELDESRNPGQKEKKETLQAKEQRAMQEKSIAKLLAPLLRRIWIN